MTTAIDFATLDLRSALDFAILVEEDAQLRYERLSRAFAGDDAGAGAVFRSMFATEGEHRARLMERRAALLGDGAPRIEVSAFDVAVEGLDVEDDLPATAHEALRLAIAGEQRAHDFFARAIPFIEDPAARAFFAELAREEVEHRELLVARLAALGPEPVGAAARGTRTPLLRLEALPPDAAELRGILPRVDAATRAIAAGVLVHGLAWHEVAAALGVSPGTVARKWRGFLHAARQHVASGLAAATLAGCAGPGALPATAPTSDPAAVATSAPAEVPVLAAVSEQARYEYKTLATSKTSTMEKEMNEAAQAGFGMMSVMGGETSFGGKEVVVVMGRSAGGPGEKSYKLLAANKTSTLEKEMQQAGREGFEYKNQTVFESAFGGREVAVIMERDNAVPAKAPQFKLLATSKTSTMQKELGEAGSDGWVLLGMVVGKTAFGGSEVVCILRKE